MKKEKIILYESTETIFTHNGIRVLKPLQCTINRNLVDYTYDLDMVYPIDDTGYWKDIIEDRIIKANGQLFRIVHTDKSVIDNSITIYAKHIFFDLQKNFIEDTNVVVKNGNIALAQLLGTTSFQHNFTGYSDIVKQNNFRCVRQNVLDALLGDQDDSFINRWGGEFDVDNFNIKMVNQVGSDKGYKIKYGRNLTGLNFKTDYTNIITRIRPIGFDGIDLGDNKYVDSPNINNYSMPIIREMKYEHVKWSGSPNYEAPDENDEDNNSVVFDDLELARAELRRLVNLEFTENEVDLPEINCEVNFVELSNTEEYSQFRNLEKISLGDIVTIEHKPLDIDIKARCISYVYDCLKQQYESIEIGHYQKNFFRETLNTNEKVENNDLDISEEIQSVYAQAISKMTEIMNNSMNGYVVLTNSEILIMDSPNKKEAKNVWKFNSSGIAHSSTGYEGDYTVGMTMDGYINGALITAGTIKGDMLEVGTITTRELAVEIQNTINTAMTEETTQALITSNLNEFSSNLSKSFITQENASEQIQTATEIAVQQATENIVNNSVIQAMESVNDQLDSKLTNYAITTINPMLQNAMQETLQESKDYVIDVTGNYYTKEEVDSNFSQTREEIELFVSETYETKKETTVKIEEAIDGVNIGTINRVFGTTEEKTYTFEGFGNETWYVYDIASDISDKEVIVSFEYDLNALFENGSMLRFQSRYISTSNDITIYPVQMIVESEERKTINVEKQQFSFITTWNALQQDAKFGFGADGVTGTFTIRKAQIKVGNKITEWSLAPEDIEDKANEFTLYQLQQYYTKNETNAQIDITKNSIENTVKNTYISKLEYGNTQIGGENLIINSGFDYNFSNWDGDVSVYYTTSDNMLSYSQTELMEINEYLLFTDAISVKGLSEKKLTLTFEYIISNVSILKNNIIARICFFDDSSLHLKEDALSYIDVSFIDGYKNDSKELSVTTFSVPEKSNYVRIYAVMEGNGEVFWDKFQLEIGDKPTSWKASIQDAVLYTNQTNAQIIDRIGELSDIISYANNSDSLTTSMKNKLISEFNDIEVIYNRLYSLYNSLGDTSFQSLPIELEEAKTELEATINSLKENINEADDSGLNEVLNKFNNFYRIAEELNQSITNSLIGLTLETKTQITQLTDSYNISVSKITTIGETVDNLTTSFNFGAEGLEIKSTADSTKYIKLDNDSLDFIDDGKVVAQISDEELLITNANIENQMRIGKISIKPSGIGGIMFIYED